MCNIQVPEYRNEDFFLNAMATITVLKTNSVSEVKRVKEVEMYIIIF